MFNLLTSPAESHNHEFFRCGNCNYDFEAKIATWVDVSGTPQVKQALLTWDFNIIHCPRCGARSFSASPFFYEDFEEGLLVAVFPGIPKNRGEVEDTIREKYGYYPVIDFFMT